MEGSINNDFDYEKINTVEKRIYVLEIRRLGSDICDYCDIEFKAGCEKDKKEKDTHIRYTHTYECNIIGFRFKKNEEVEIHF